MDVRAFVGGRALTMDRGTAGTVVVEGDRIVAVGERALLDAYPHAVVEDLHGRTVCPGFIDAHHHLSIAALHPCWADLSTVATADELRAALVTQAAREPGAPWVRGAGWNEAHTRFVPHRRDLDAMALGRPVMVAHYSLHQGVVDSAALDELGIGRGTPDPPGGQIGRDPDGAPNGMLIERAWSEAHARSMAPYTDPDRWAEHIAAAATALLRDGITAVHDAACPPGAEAAYRRLAAAGRLPISVLMMPHPTALLGPLDTGRLDGPPTGDGDEIVRVGAIKLFADGGVAPAMDVRVSGRELKGGMLFDGLEAQASLAVSRGFRVAVHAIGNVGLDAAMGAFGACAARHPGGDHRFRVEHACLASSAQLSRLAALGGVAVVQPGFVHHLGEAVESMETRGATWLPFADVLGAGAIMAASSDSPCAFHEPVLTSARGANRRTGSGRVLDPGQAVSYEDWLRAYTAGAAYAGGQENERGRLAPGLRADLVVLDGALDADHPPRVAQTWVGGRLVYAAP
jgi:predicted amidohydrolase YtcJ